MNTYKVTATNSLQVRGPTRIVISMEASYFHEAHIDAEAILSALALNPKWVMEIVSIVLVDPEDTDE